MGTIQWPTNVKSIRLILTSSIQYIVNKAGHINSLLTWHNTGDECFAIILFKN